MARGSWRAERALINQSLSVFFKNTISCWIHWCLPFCCTFLSFEVYLKGVALFRPDLCEIDFYFLPFCDNKGSLLKGFLSLSLSPRLLRECWIPGRVSQSLLAAMYFYTFTELERHLLSGHDLCVRPHNQLHGLSLRHRRGKLPLWILSHFRRGM